MVAGTVTLHAELPPGSPNLLLLRALVGSPILHAPARQVLDVSTDKPPLLPKLVVCPHWCACKFGILEDKKLESLLVAVSCCCLLGAWQLLPGDDRGFSCLGVLGSLKWVLGVYRLPGWKQLELHFHQGKCWWVCLRNMGEVESRREAEQFVSVHKHLQPDATMALSFYEMWLTVTLRSQTVTDTAAEPLFHWQRLGFSFWHWVSAPKSCCFVSVHSSVMEKPLRKGKEVSSCSY